ncbi:MAG: acyl-CoA dehydrogenase family protein [Actinomycetota bacterium]|nr:acyl-CoA dehydrogenase family protein [Actinomycetota bacterium]
MRFAPSKEQEHFGASLRDLLDAAEVPAVARAWALDDFAAGRQLWKRLGEAGVTALGLTRTQGGYGADAVDLVIGFLELGRAAVPGPFVESAAVLPVLLGEPAHADPQRVAAHAETLAALAEGDLMATVAIPPEVPFAVDAGAADAIFLVQHDRLMSATATTEVGSVDRARRLAEVSATAEVAQRVETAAACDMGALATAAQILGAGDAVLRRATEYATQRRQFGRPIGQFQAVKHQLADAMVGLELARPLLFGAAVSVTAQASTARRDISAAKLACTSAAYRASRASLQVHGAIGYTAEYDLSLWLTKIRALVSSWGTARVHRSRVLDAI